MNATLALVAGVAIGLVAAKFLIDSPSCCQRVALGVRDKVGEELGAGAQAVGDAVGFWGYAPGLLDLFGVK